MFALMYLSLQHLIWTLHYQHQPGAALWSDYCSAEGYLLQALLYVGLSANCIHSRSAPFKQVLPAVYLGLMLLGCRWGGSYWRSCHADVATCRSQALKSCQAA